MNISWSDCDVQQKVDCVRQPVMTNSGVGPRRSSKALPKENLPQKKFMFTVWWSATHLIHYSFLNFDETITSEKYAQQIDAKHWKLQCLQPALVNRKDLNSSPWQCPTAHCMTNTSKVERIRIQSFSSSTIFTWPLANWLPTFQASQQLFFFISFQRVFLFLFFFFKL